MPSIHDPMIQSSILPLLLILVSIAGLRLATGATVSRTFAGVLVGLVATGIAMFISGIPGVPPVGASQKAICILGLSAVLGVVIQQAPRQRPILLGALIAVLIWIAWPVVLQGNFEKLSLVLTTALILALPFRKDAGKHAPLHHLAALTMILIGLAVTAISASAASVGQISAVTAATAGGFLMWNWPRARFNATPALATALAACAALTAQLLLFTRAGYWPLLVIAAGGIGQILAGIVNQRRDATSPLTLVISTALPAIGVAIALVIMTVTQPATSNSGY